MIRSRPFIAALLLLLPCCPGQQGILLSGPLVGPATETEVSLWVQTRRPARVRYSYWPTGRPHERRLSHEVRTLPENDHCVVVRLVDLPFGKRFRYDLHLDDQRVVRPYETSFQTQVHWRWRGDPPDFSVAVGSCAYVNEPVFDRPGKGYGGDTEVFLTMARLHPDVMLWLGDNTYFREPDWTSESGMRSRYRKSRSLAELQPFLAKTHHYAIWDDHDFGPNDSDWTNPLRRAALRTFRLYWPNPGYGLEGAPGVYTRFTWGDAEFFLLDDRYHRTPNRAPASEGKTMWGRDQLRWLLDALTSSEATFKVVANGNQILNTRHRHEHLGLFPADRTTLLRGIRERKVAGVVFVTGDRHHAELIRVVPPAEGSYPLYDFTSSPLLSGIHALGSERDNPDRVEGTAVDDARNFGRLRFSGPTGDRVLTFECWEAGGKLRWSHRVAATELRPEAAARR